MVEANTRILERLDPKENVWEQWNKAAWFHLSELLTWQHLGSHINWNFGHRMIIVPALSHNGTFKAKQSSLFFIQRVLERFQGERDRVELLNSKYSCTRARRTVIEFQGWHRRRWRSFEPLWVRLRVWSREHIHKRPLTLHRSCGRFWRGYLDRHRWCDLGFVDSNRPGLRCIWTTINVFEIYHFLFRRHYKSRKAIE